MKIRLLHTADMHLDSSFSSYLPKEKAAERKRELLISFENMVSYAEKEGIHYFLIAGDMFDKNVVSEKTVRFVENVITCHPEISFYYLRGNHDIAGFLAGKEKPANLLTFETGVWSRYTIETPGEKTVCIYGTELNAVSQTQMLTALQPEEPDINIVMLHGQDNDSLGRDRGVQIDLPRLRGKAVDYLALGHIHGARTTALDSRGLMSYPGCPEGRGFDECGEKGFNVLTIDTVTGRIELDFVPSSIRKVMEVSVDITGTASTRETIESVKKALDEKLNQEIISSKDIVKIILTGDLPVDAEIDADLITKQFEGDFYFLKTVDKTGHIIDYNSFRNDISLKGEFVRQVMADSTLSDSEKAEIIRTGILLLAGRKEEV